METDTIAAVGNSVNAFSITTWFWIALVEFIMLIVIIFYFSKRIRSHTSPDKETCEVKKFKNNVVDMKNLVNSIHNAKDLYLELSKKCHPDKFENKPERRIAEEIFQEITRHRRNYDKLLLLKIRIKNELNSE